MDFIVTSEMFDNFALVALIFGLVALGVVVHWELERRRQRRREIARRSTRDGKGKGKKRKRSNR